MPSGRVKEGASEGGQGGGREGEVCQKGAKEGGKEARHSPSASVMYFAEIMRARQTCP